MSPIDQVYQSSSNPNERIWPLTFLGLFSVSSFFKVFSHSTISIFFAPAKITWKPKTPFRVKTFMWLLANKRVDTKAILHKRRTYKAINPDVGVMCKESEAQIDHLFSFIAQLPEVCGIDRLSLLDQLGPIL